jgi:predicted Zn-dependent protease
VSAMAERIYRYRGILKEDPHSRVFVPLADLLRQNGETEEAIALLESGLLRDPDHQSALVVLGCTLLQTGRQEHGVKVLQKVLELSPDNFVVLRTLAEHFLSIDGFTHAIPLLERLVDFEPEQTEWPKLLNDARERLVQDQDKPAEDDQSESLPAANRSVATMTLVDILVAQGYLDKALAALERMKQEDPDRADVQERLAQLKSGDLAPGAPSTEKKATAEDRLLTRHGQKEQFGEWIENFKSNQDPDA